MQRPSSARSSSRSWSKGGSWTFRFRSSAAEAAVSSPDAALPVQLNGAAGAGVEAVRALNTGLPQPETPSESAKSAVHVSRCHNEAVAARTAGTYTACGKHHGKMAYRRADGLVVIYFYEDYRAPSNRGWWMGPQLNGDDVYAHNPEDVGEKPPETGWHVPHDGPVDDSLLLHIFENDRRRFVSNIPSGATAFDALKCPQLVRAEQGTIATEKVSKTLSEGTIMNEKVSKSLVSFQQQGDALALRVAQLEKLAREMQFRFSDLSATQQKADVALQNLSQNLAMRDNVPVPSRDASIGKHFEASDLTCMVMEAQERAVQLDEHNSDIWKQLARFQEHLGQLEDQDESTWKQLASMQQQFQTHATKSEERMHEVKMHKICLEELEERIHETNMHKAFLEQLNRVGDETELEQLKGSSEHTPEGLCALLSEKSTAVSDTSPASHDDTGMFSIKGELRVFERRLFAFEKAWRKQVQEMIKESEGRTRAAINEVKLKSIKTSSGLSQILETFESFQKKFPEVVALQDSAAIEKPPHDLSMIRQPIQPTARSSLSCRSTRPMTAGRSANPPESSSLLT